jgi:pimeloyl-ACP methyl ester carboxylesterase
MKHRHPTQLPPYQPPPLSIIMASDGTLPPAPRLDAVRRPLRHIREQLRSLTGWGLHPKSAGASQVTRASLPAGANGISLSFLSAGHSGAQRIVFIHGSPGRSDEWHPFLAACPPDQYRIAIDRAGYGDSQPRLPLPTVAAQAAGIVPLLTKGCVLVAHSYGATVALRLAADYPDLVAGLLLIGCPVDPELEHVHPFQRMAARPWAARLMPQGLHASNMELLPFRADLQDLVPRLGGVTAKVTCMQGLRDTLVPPSNAALLSRHLTGTAAPRSILLPDGDHYLPWTHRSTIEQAVGYVLRDCAAVSRG